MIAAYAKYASSHEIRTLPLSGISQAQLEYLLEAFYFAISISTFYEFVKIGHSQFLGFMPWQENEKKGQVRPGAGDSGKRRIG